MLGSLCKMAGMGTNRKEPGDEVIWWCRERCGASEAARGVIKEDLALFVVLTEDPHLKHYGLSEEDPRDFLSSKLVEAN